jgi:hypothetical protein
MHNQHAGLSELLAEQRMSYRQEQAARGSAHAGCWPAAPPSALAGRSVVAVGPSARRRRRAGRPAPTAGWLIERRPCSPSIAWPTWVNDPTVASSGPAPSVAATWSTMSWWRPERPARPILGPRYREARPEALTLSQFDEEFLYRHAMAWSADHRPD